MNLARITLALGLLCNCMSMPARAEVKTQTVTYQDGNVKLEGYVAYDPTKVADGAPGVLVVHQWLGLTDYEQLRCRQLAELGYVAFALDIYGKDDRPANVGEAVNSQASTRWIASFIASD